MYLADGFHASARSHASPSFRQPPLERAFVPTRRRSFLRQARRSGQQHRSRLLYASAVPPWRLEQRHFRSALGEPATEEERAISTPCCWPRSHWNSRQPPPQRRHIVRRVSPPDAKVAFYQQPRRSAHCFHSVCMHFPHSPATGTRACNNWPRRWHLWAAYAFALVFLKPAMHPRTIRRTISAWQGRRTCRIRRSAHGLPSRPAHPTGSCRYEYRHASRSASRRKSQVGAKRAALIFKQSDIASPGHVLEDVVCMRMHTRTIVGTDERISEPDVPEAL